MKRIVLLLLLLHTGALCAATQNHLVITLSSDKGEYLLGEPVALKCSFENQGDTPLTVAYDFNFPAAPSVLHITGPTRKDCVESQGKYEIGAYITPPSIAPHQSLTLGPILASAYGAVDVGEYEFCVVYDSGKLGAADLRALLPSVQAESNHLRIRIVSPKGIDAAAFKKTANACNQLLFAREILLKDFPASTYAGYALAQNTVGFSNQALTWLDDPEGSILRYYRTPDGRIVVTQAHIDSDKAAMAAFARVAGPFLQAHPDFLLAPQIRRMYALCLGLTGHIPEAMAQIQALAQGEGKEAAEAKSYLENKRASSAKGH